MFSERGMATVKNNLRDKLEDGELDLSMMQLTDVPVKVCCSSVSDTNTDMMFRR